VLGDGDGVLNVGRARAVDRTNRPAVVVFPDTIVTAGDEHRLDREHQSRPQPQPSARPAFVAQVRLLVHRAAHAMPTELGRDAIAGGAANQPDGMLDVTEPTARLRGRDPRLERPGGDRDQLLVFRTWVPN